MPDGLRVWLVTRYEEARAVLVNPALSKDSRKAAPLHDRQEEQGTRRTFLDKVLQSHMLNMDPPDHTRLRKLVAKAFTLRRVELLRPTIERIVAGLLDELAGQDEVDLLVTFAFPLSLAVVGELFGVPEAERTDFHTLSNRIAFGIDPAAMGAASVEMAGYLKDLIAQACPSPG